MSILTLTKRLRLQAVGLISLMVAAMLVLSACDLVGDDTDDDDEQQQQQQQQQSQEQQEQAQETTAAPATTTAAEPPAEDPAPEPPPAASGGGEGATAYSIIFPSLALVMTDDGVATGLVNSDGYVVVDEQFLHGATAADVLFSSGAIIEAVPLVGRDMFTGIAYLGPLDRNFVRRLPGAQLGDGEGIRPGSSVFAIGYGAGDTSESLPTIFSGVLSGVTEWEPGERTFLRTNARPDGVSVGMVMVDSEGTVIGFAPSSMVGLGWYVSTGDLARSLSSDHMGESMSEAAVMTSTEHSLSLTEGQRSASLIVSDDATGEAVLVTVRSDSASQLQMFDGEGDLQQEASLVSGSTIVALAPETVGPYEIVITPEADAMEESPTYDVSANVPLMVVAEAEDAAVLSLDEPFVGRIDIPGDADSFNLPVRGGAVYEISAESLMIDSVLLAQFDGASTVDDDSGGGPFGVDAALTLEPEEDGIITLTVKDYADEGTGTYLLSVTQIGGAMPAEEDEEPESMMMTSAATLPNPMGDVSLRGEVMDDVSQPTLLGIGSELGENGSLLIHDDDGIFEIVASIIGTDQSTARVYVFNADNQVIVSGRVIANCGSGEPCLASAVFISPEDAPAPPGTWRVLLQPDGAETGITEWQVEVHRYDTEE